MMNATEAYIRRDDLNKGVTVLEFFHPKANSLPARMLEQLTDEIRKCSDDKRVQVVILQSGGEASFCAGASFQELTSLEDAESGKAFFMGFARLVNACRKCSKLIIGRVQGKAIGGGVGLAAAVDYCLASNEASVRLSELGIGIGPFVIEPVVTRRIGHAAFTTLCLDYERSKSAQWAHEKGLYNEIFYDPKALDFRVMELAHSLIATSQEARQALKSVFWSGCEDWDELLEERAALSGSLILSDFSKKALNRFKS